MINRITKHRKTLKHCTLLLLCSLLANTSFAESLSINVYLKLKHENPIEKLIKKFNQFLEEQQISQTYHIKPYIKEHPLHLTLFLADYKKEQIPRVLQQAQTLAEQKKPITLLSSEFIGYESTYILLSVTHEAKLDQISREALGLLAPLRDKNARIPEWAAKDKGRQLIFKRYGSPSVVEYFNPHFSILEANHLSKKQKIHLYRKLKDLISQFARHHKTQVTAVADAIGVAIADDQGQIVKELKSFPLI